MKRMKTESLNLRAIVNPNLRNVTATGFIPRAVIVNMDAPVRNFFRAATRVRIVVLVCNIPVQVI